MSADLHGNGADFDGLNKIFSRLAADEARHLEAQLTALQVALTHELFEDAALVMAPCSVLLAHGAPGDAPRHPSDLECVGPASRRLVLPRA